MYLGDTNADGCSDFMVKAGNTPDSPFYYYANRGHGAWQKEDRVDLGKAPALNMNSPNVTINDYNNDGRADISAKIGDRLKIWLAHADGWRSEATIDVLAPTVGGSGGFNDEGISVIDMNGDNITDVAAARDGHIAVWYHNGNGNYEKPTTLLNPPRGVGDGVLRMGDLNNDGVGDPLFIGNRTITYWLNLGDGTLSAPITLQNTPAYNAQNTAIREADINGDGADEIVFSNDQGIQYVDFSTGPQPFLLKNVDNGLGRTIHITYKSSTEDYIADQDAGKPWEHELPFPVQVVNRVTVHDANSGDNYTIDYHYRDGFYDGVEKEFRGFMRSQEIKVGDETAATTVAHLVFDVGLEDESHKGMLLESEVLSEGGHCSGDFRGCFVRTVNQLETRVVVDGSETASGEPIAYAFVRQTDSFLHEQTADPVHLRQQFAQDEYGNQTQNFNYGQVCGADLACGNDEILAHIEYIYDEERYIFDRAKRMVATDINGNFVSESRLYYDGQPFEGLPLGEMTRGDLTRQTESLGPKGGNRFVSTKRLQYDQYGNVITMMDANGNRISVEFDPIQQTFPVVERLHLEEGKSLTYAAAYHHGFGKITGATDYNGHAHAFTYDTFGRISSTVKPGDTLEQPTMTYTYQVGSPRSFIKTEQRQQSGADDMVTSITYYDGLGRKLQMRSQGTDGRVIVEEAVTYNARQSVREQYQPYFADSFDYAAPDPNLPHSTLHYDPIGRTLRTVNPDGTFSSVIHKPLAELHFDEEDNHPDSPHHDTPKTLVYDGLKRLVRAEEVNIVDGQIESDATRYKHNLLGNLTQIVDAQGNIKTMEYDALGRMISMNDPNKGERQYAYDDNGNLIQMTDAIGQILQYTYDAANRQISERWVFNNGKADVLNALFHYDDDLSPLHPDAENTMGQISYVEDQTGTIYFSYDPVGNPTGVIRHFEEEGVTLVTRSEYDTMDRLRRLTLADGFTVNYEYDARGLLKRVPGFVEHIAYTASDQRESIRYANGVRTIYGYDLRQRLDRLQTMSGQTTLEDLRYHFDKASNILSIADARPDRTAADDLSQTFSYDALYRLTGADGTYGAIDFAYDSIGNLIRKSSTVADPRLNLGEMHYGENAGPQAMTLAGNRLYRYDANGNLSRKENPDGSSSTHYTWDARDRLLSVDDGETLSTFGYDAGYQRVKQTIRKGDVVTTTLYGANSVELRGDELTYYIFDDEQRIARITMPFQPERLLQGFHDAPSTIPPQQVERLWYTADHLGGTSLLINEDGSLAARVAYYPYGLTRYEQGEADVYYQFTGKELDATGLHYFETRYYDAEIGRFIGVDPFYLQQPHKGIANPQLLNLYAYGLNNPVRYNDPSGLNSEDQVDEGKIVQETTEGVIAAGAKALEDSTVGKYLGNAGGLLSLFKSIHTLTDPKASEMDKFEAGYSGVGSAAGLAEGALTVAGYGKAAAAAGALSLMTAALSPLVMIAKGAVDAREGAEKSARESGRYAYAIGVAAGLLGLPWNETRNQFALTEHTPNKYRRIAHKSHNEALYEGWKKVAGYSQQRKFLALQRLAQKMKRSGHNYNNGRAWTGNLDHDLELIVLGTAQALRIHYGEFVNK